LTDLFRSGWRILISNQQWLTVSLSLHNSSSQQADFILANLAWFSEQGISLVNYYGVAHPSQPNYAAAVGGSQNRVISGATSVISSRVETLVDRLEAKGISWGLYQEDLP